MYRITNTVTNEQSFPSIISALAVGDSAVINCDTFSYNQQQYHRGDVIVKLNDTKEILSPAVNTGVYVPIDSTRQSGNSYTIKYAYSESVKPGDERSLDFELGSDSAIYGQTYDFTTEDYHATFPMLMDGTAPIKPVVKTFIKLENNTYEEIALNEDLIVSTGSSHWSVEVSPIAMSGDRSHIYVQVK